MDVLVIGAGQAGLSSAHHLRRTGFDGRFAVLDADAAPGGAWQHRWPSLRLGGVHGVHDLPGLRLEEQDGQRPAAQVISEYFDRYERAFALPVHRPVQVRAVRRSGERLLVAGDETWSARAVINATGTWTRPFVPRYPGQDRFRGRQLHTADYRGPEPFRGSRVVVVGGGISAVELLTEIAEVADTTWMTRRPPVFTGEFGPDDGRAAVAEADRRVRAGQPPGSVVSLTGLPDTAGVRRARESGVLHREPVFRALTPRGFVDADGRERPADVILWATGFRAALDHLAPLGLREPGGGIRMDGTQVVAEPRLQLVGYGPSASTVGATRAGREAVTRVRRLLG